MDDPTAMDAHRDHPVTDDLSALAWVLDELRKTLEAAHKSLRRYLREVVAVEGADLDDVEPAILRNARQAIHQSVGALELVNLPEGAMLMRSAEQLVQRFVAKPQRLDAASVEAIERVSFALLDYLGQKLSGRPVQPVALFAQWRALLELTGAERVHPADLWPHDWQWHAIAAPAVPPRQPDAALLAGFEKALLALVRQNTPAAAAVLARDCLGLAAAGHGEEVTQWRLAAAFFQAWGLGLLPPDMFLKRTASRVMAQLRGRVKGEDGSGERLAQDLLFYCARAWPAPGVQASLLAAVHAAYGLTPQTPVDYNEPLYGRRDPGLVLQARKRVGIAKEVWNGAAAGDAERVAHLNEAFTLVGDSISRLYEDGGRLARALSAAAGATARAGRLASPELGMEVATSLLYLDAALDDADFDQPEHETHARRLAERIERVLAGQPSEPLEPWMEELYRRVSDRLTLGSVVQELRVSLAEIERQIDQFFRSPAETGLLAGVPGLLGSMRGVLSVLGVDVAIRTLQQMRTDVERLLHGEVSAQEAAALGAFQRLAANLGALGFMIDMLGVQPQAAKSLFTFDAELGVLTPVMGRSAVGAEAAGHDDVPLEALSAEIEALQRDAQVHAVPALSERLESVQEVLHHAEETHRADEETAARAQVRQVIHDFVATATSPLGLDPLVPPSAARPPQPGPIDTPAFQPTGLEDDAEMREIFLEESRETVAQARQALADLAGDGGNLSLLTQLRRAFHTLKGSSRMVGLNAFGEAAWACEQLYNHWLAEQKPAHRDLRTFTGDALDYFAAWTDAIGHGDAAAFLPDPLMAGAEALRHAGELMRVPLPGSLVSRPMTLSMPTSAVAASTDDDRPDHVDLEVPIDEEARPVMEALQATRPMELPMAASEAEELLPVGVTLVDLALDFEADEPNDSLKPDEAGEVIEVASSSDGAPVDVSFDDLEREAEPFGLYGLPPGPVERIEVEMPGALEDAPSSWRTPLRTQTTTSDSLSLGEPLAEAPAAPESDLVRPVEPVLEIEPMQLDPVSERADEPAEVPVDAPVDVPVDVAIDLPVEAQASQPLPGPEVSESAVSDEEEAGVTAEVIHLDEFRAQVGAEVLRAAQPERDPDEDQIKVIGPLRLQIPLFNIYLNEADEVSRRLGTELTLWAMEMPRPLGEEPVALAHTLAGNSATVGFTELAQLARRLEDTLTLARALQAAGVALDPSDAELFVIVSDEIRRLLHQFAAGFLQSTAALVVERLGAWQHAAQVRLDEVRQEPPIDDSTPVVLPPVSVPALPAPASVREPLEDFDSDIDQVDQIDADLFPIFAEEAQELLPLLESQVEAWLQDPAQPGASTACMRTLHTFKGSARLAGAMRLGEMAHRFESAIEALIAGQATVPAAALARLGQRVDALMAAFEALSVRQAGGPLSTTAGGPWTVLPATLAGVPSEARPASGGPVVAADAPVSAGGDPDRVVALPDGAAGAIDWRAFLARPSAPPAPVAERGAVVNPQPLRVRAPLLDRLVNLAGEVSITRSRLEAEIGQIRGALGDLTDNLERLNQQLHDVTLQADTQLESRKEAARAAAQAFDPLELDRYTRLQELTRMMAESVNDVATVRSALQRTLQTAEDELAVQGRLTRELQSDLLRTRMVEFESLSERLYRVVRLAAKETGKQVRFDIVGGSIEVDRGVLDRMNAAFEHLLRNCVTHGIETPEQRQVVGKDPTGSIVVSLEQEGNEVSVEIRDDGAGLDLPRIRARAVEMGLVVADAKLSDQALMHLIFAPGLSTVAVLTEVAGRGVGMDVVKSDVQAMGGRIEVRSEAGRGTRFKLVMPLTTVVTQVVILRTGTRSIAVPSNLVELVQRLPADHIEQARRDGHYSYGGLQLPFYWLGALLDAGGSSLETMSARTLPLVIVRSAQQRIALHVDEVLGSHEVVVKNLGPQLSRLPGLAGMTLLASGVVALIYNPVALAAVYGEAAHRLMQGQPALAPADGQVRREPARPAPLILVVDDSLTVRRITKRLLEREGYRVALAKDGLEALDQLAGERPVVVLSDIEMPRMDGFDLLRNIRGDTALTDLPVIMITSRIAQKHRDIAAELGASHYLGKPYSEEELLRLIGSYAPPQHSPRH
jgi:chemosensory pili system protein ChpA (sensor histidine kinase/response regulator)